MTVQLHLVRLGQARALTQSGGGVLFPEDFSPLRWM
ncbi:hypothetical protein E1H18_1760 [Caulobacter sp. RHG1]|nr:hypothetical protein [Caulobacter sp. RHG1]